MTCLFSNSLFGVKNMLLMLKSDRQKFWKFGGKPILLVLAIGA